MNRALPVGYVLKDQYVIESVIGYGSVGFVYQCEDKIILRKVAIKEVFPASCWRIENEVYPAPDQINAEAFFGERKNALIKEAELLSGFSSIPYMVTVYEIFEENNTIYMVMELIDGITLREYLKIYGTLSEEDARGIGLLILKALKALHSAGVFHLDVCPANIMLGNTVRLLDFEASWAFQKKEERIITLRPGYSPPEQYFRSGEIGPWSDLYALGAVLYEAVTLKKLPDAMKRIERDKVMESQIVNSDISGDFNRIILKAIMLDSKERYQAAEEFEAALIRDGESLKKIKHLIATCLPILVVEILLMIFIFLSGCSVLVDLSKSHSSMISRIGLAYLAWVFL